MRIFSLLFVLFFASCGRLSEAKKMEMKLPKDTTTVVPAGFRNAVTLILDGNPDSVYGYKGPLDSNTVIRAISRDTTGGLNDFLAQECDTSSFIIVKWYNEEKYTGIINTIDLLKSNGYSKYALTPVTKAELLALSKITHRNYKEQ